MTDRIADQATDEVTAVVAAPMVETPEGLMPERRRVPRLKSLLSGIIVFDGHNTTMDCTVRNISAYGARVVLPDAFRLPDGFNLVVPHHEQTHRAEVVWRKGESVGLELSDVAEHEQRQRVTPREAAAKRRKEMLGALYA